jgi:hypothetical protein
MVVDPAYHASPMPSAGGASSLLVSGAAIAARFFHNIC